MKNNNLSKISIMIAMLAISSQIKIPIPIIGYFTLQLSVVLIIGFLLSPKESLSVGIIYLIGGLIGIPWFANGGGIKYLVEPTLGFLLLFPITSYLTSRLFQKYSTLKAGFLITILMTLFIWIIGVAYIYVFINVNIGSSMTINVAGSILLSTSFMMDLILCIPVTIVGVRVFKTIQTNQIDYEF